MTSSVGCAAAGARLVRAAPVAAAAAGRTGAVPGAEDFSSSIEADSTGALVLTGLTTVGAALTTDAFVIPADVSRLVAVAGWAAGAGALSWWSPDPKDSNWGGGCEHETRKSKHNKGRIVFIFSL